MIEQWQATPVAEIDPEHVHRFRHGATPRPARRAAQPPHRVADSGRVDDQPAGIRRGDRARAGTVAALAAVHRADRRHRPPLQARRRPSSLGALLADVPHTRATQLIATSNDTTLIERYQPRDVELRGADGHRRRAAGGAQRLRRTDGIAVGSGTELRQHTARRRRRRSPSSSGPVRSSACHVRRLRSTPRSPSYQSSVDELVESNELENYVSRLEELIGDDDEQADPDVTRRRSREVPPRSRHRRLSVTDARQGNEPRRRSSAAPHR